MHVVGSAWVIATTQALAAVLRPASPTAPSAVRCYPRKGVITWRPQPSIWPGGPLAR
jgi:hypothetical protein